MSESTLDTVPDSSPRIFRWRSVRNYHLLNLIPGMVALKLGHSLGHDVGNILVVFEAVTLVMILGSGALRQGVHRMQQIRKANPDDAVGEDVSNARSAVDFLMGLSFLTLVSGGWATILSFGIWGF
tara:strand:- start:2924 stop:3301 length:378 start_codon:yes stop_codon:yes gene_type:complete